MVVKDPIDDDVEWVRCDRPDCDLEIVRPGKTQCSGDYDGGCGGPLEPTWCQP